MRIVYSLLFTLLLSGCVLSGPPTVLEVTDSKGMVVGRAFAIDQDRFLTADHVFESHRLLFVQEKLITVLQRDRKKDRLRFKLPKKFIEKVRVARWRKTLPKLGELVFWSNGEGIVLSVSQSVDFRNKNYADLIVLSGQVNPGNSGLPVYDKKDQVLGMIIGGEKGKVYLTAMASSIESGSN